MVDESRLVGLREREAEVLSSLARISTVMREFARIETKRPLNPDETRRARDLRWAHERLRLELHLLRRESALPREGVSEGRWRIKLPWRRP